MAEFDGAHVEMGVAVKSGGSDLFFPIWSETIALGNKTVQTARGDATLKDLASKGALVFRVRAQASGPVFIAKGISIDANTSKAHLLASELRDFPAVVGETVMVTTAS